MCAELITFFQLISQPSPQPCNKLSLHPSELHLYFHRIRFFCNATREKVRISSQLVFITSRLDFIVYPFIFLKESMAIATLAATFAAATLTMNNSAFGADYIFQKRGH